MRSINQIKRDLEKKKKEKIAKISLKKKQEVLDLARNGLTIGEICKELDLDLDEVCGVISENIQAVLFLGKIAKE